MPTMSLSPQPRRLARPCRLQSLRRLLCKGVHDGITDYGVMAGIPVALLAQLVYVKFHVFGHSDATVTDNTFTFLLEHGSHLEALELTGNCQRVTGQLLEAMTPTLLSSSSTATLATLSRLHELTLRGCGITDETFSNWESNCARHSLSWRLKTLNLTGCEQFTSLGVAGFVQRHCPQMHTLIIANCEGVMASLFSAHYLSRGFDCLRELDLSGCTELADVVLKNIAQHLTSLERLALCQCEHIGDDGIVHLSHSGLAHQLRELNVYGCRRLTTVAALAIGSLSSLEELNLGACPLIADAGLHAIVSGCPQLRGLNLYNCDNLSGAALASLGALHEMRILSCSRCSHLTDDILISIVGEMPLLRSLSVVNCPSLTDAALQALPSHCGHLQEMYLSMCPHFTVAGALELRNMPTLVVVDLTMCRRIERASDADRAALAVALQLVEHPHF